MEDALTADDPFKIKSGGLVDMKSMKGLYLFFFIDFIFWKQSSSTFICRNVHYSKINKNEILLWNKWYYGGFYHAFSKRHLGFIFRI